MTSFESDSSSINQNILKLNANLKIILKNEDIPFPDQKTFLSMAITVNGFTNLIQLPIIIESTKPELQLIIRKDSPEGIIIGENYNLRPITGGEKLYLSAINNSSKPKQVVVKSYNANSGQIIGETLFELKPSKETPVILNLDKNYDKDLNSNIYEINSDEKLGFEIFDQENPIQTNQKRILTLQLRDPREFVYVDSTLYVPSSLPKNKNSSLFFNLKSRFRELTPQPVVEMVFEKNRNPSMISEGTGIKSRPLNPEETVQLFTSGINYSPFEPFQGEVFLNIDGIKRMFRYGFKPYSYGDPFALVLKTNAHLEIPEIKVSNDFKTLNVIFEADVMNSKAKLEAGVWDLNKDPIEPINFQKSDVSCFFKTPRKESVKIIQEKGAAFLKFQGCVDDWRISWNVEGLNGAKVIHAWLKDEYDNIISRKSVKTIIDRTAPDKFEIDAFPKSVNPEQEITLRVITSDEESDISKVELFFAQKLEGKNVDTIPLIKFKRNKEIPSLWEGNYLVPKDSNGAQFFTLVSTNGFGISKRINATWEVVQAKTPTTGEIVATVLEGGRKQPNLTVKLFDQKGKLIKTQITDVEGKTKFANLQPNSYSVIVEKISSGRKSTQNINLKPGDISMTSLELLQ